MSEKFEVSKKDFLEFKISSLEAKMSEIEVSIAKFKQKKLDLQNEIREIKETNRDVFPARGRKKKSEVQ